MRPWGRPPLTGPRCPSCSTGSQACPEDPKQRFAQAHVQAMLATLPSSDPPADVERTAAAVLRAVEAAHARSDTVVPAKVRQDVAGLPPVRLAHHHFLALWAYSTELYEDDARTQSARYQIYGEFNRICREYGQAQRPSGDVLSDWALFYPFAFHLDAAIRQLPAIPMVLYRGGGFHIDAHRCGGGGCLIGTALQGS